FVPLPGISRHFMPADFSASFLSITRGLGSMFCWPHLDGITLWRTSEQLKASISRFLLRYFSCRTFAISSAALFHSGGLRPLGPSLLKNSSILSGLCLSGTCPSAPWLG